MQRIIAAAIFCACVSFPAYAQTLVSETIGATSIVSRAPVSRGERSSFSRVRVVVRGKAVWVRVAARQVEQRPQGIAVMAYPSMGFAGGIVDRARQYAGMNAAQIGLHRRTLWCQTFVNFVLGDGGTRSDLAASSLKFPRSGGYPGDIAVIGGRRGVQHVGIVTGTAPSGNPIIISGNHNNRVVETEYPRGAVVAFVRP